MIGANFQTTLEGSLLTAFRIYCMKKGCQTAAEGFRNMIRELPEFNELTTPLDKQEDTKQENQCQEKNYKTGEVHGQEGTNS